MCMNTPAKPSSSPQTIYTTVPQGGQITFPITWIATSGFDGYGGYISAIVGGAACATTKKVNKDGCRCKKCKEFYPYAESNQDDGTLICYPCRKRL